MATRNRVVLFAFAALAISISLAACSGGSPSTQDAKWNETVKAEAARIAQGGQGHGFICFGDADGGVGCVCKDDAPSGDIWSCVGMERVCNALGTGQICNPSTDVCHCAAILKKS
ncbi:MAG TPA: hypothetical protein VM099_15550 [Gemmatimonadaceae bacterium]|nr:hypothetical protein [Gemmatimonadaceae bacterium]